MVAGATTLAGDHACRSHRWRLLAQGASDTCKQLRHDFSPFSVAVPCFVLARARGSAAHQRGRRSHSLAGTPLVEHQQALG